jgi:hypothetical protein
MDAFDIQIKPDNLRLDLLEVVEVIVITGGPAVARITVREKAAIDDAIFNRLLGIDLQDP